MNVFHTWCERIEYQTRARIPVGRDYDIIHNLWNVYALLGETARWPSLDGNMTLLIKNKDRQSMMLSTQKILEGAQRWSCGGFILCQARSEYQNELTDKNAAPV